MGLSLIRINLYVTLLLIKKNKTLLHRKLLTNILQVKGLKYQANNLLDETLDVDVRVGGFKLGGGLLDVRMVYSVPVVMVTLDGNTVAVLF